MDEVNICFSPFFCPASLFTRYFVSPSLLASFSFSFSLLKRHLTSLVCTTSPVGRLRLPTDFPVSLHGFGFRFALSWFGESSASNYVLCSVNQLDVALILFPSHFRVVVQSIVCVKSMSCVGKRRETRQ